MKITIRGGTNHFRYVRFNCLLLSRAFKFTTKYRLAIDLIQNYGAPSVAPAGDPYLSSYYGATSFPYQLDGAWSSGAAGGDGAMAFLGGYGAQQGPSTHHQHHQDSYGIDGMFGPAGGFGSFGQPTAFGGGGGYGGFQHHHPHPHHQQHTPHGSAAVAQQQLGSSEYSTWERKAHNYDDYYQRGGDVYQSTARWHFFLSFDELTITIIIVIIIFMI